MSHAVGTIRAEEDQPRRASPHRLGPGERLVERPQLLRDQPAPSHDNVVYEVHGYPPAGVEQLHVPEHPGHPRRIWEPHQQLAGRFYADLEEKKIPNLAWDFEPYSDCSPDLLNVTNSSSTLQATSWGSIVQSYLLAH